MLSEAACDFSLLVVPTTKHVLDSSRDILLCLRILSALISEEGKDNENDDTESNGYGSTFEDETSLKSNGFMEFSGVGPFYGYGKNSTRGFHNEPPNAVRKVDDEINRQISNGAKGKRSISSVLNVEDDEPPLDFLHLKIPKMDVLGDAFGEQSLDVGSWLNIDDTILHDDDFTGLEIPMDDLSNIKMTV
nr:hypothetical protein [Tanacetum cinerariifolium]